MAVLEAQVRQPKENFSSLRHKLAVIGGVALLFLGGLIKDVGPAYAYEELTNCPPPTTWDAGMRIPVTSGRFTDPDGKKWRMSREDIALTGGAGSMQGWTRDNDPTNGCDARFSNSDGQGVFPFTPVPEPRPRPAKAVKTTNFLPIVEK